MLPILIVGGGLLLLGWLASRVRTAAPGSMLFTVYIGRHPSTPAENLSDAIIVQGISLASNIMTSMLRGQVYNVERRDNGVAAVRFQVPESAAGRLPAYFTEVNASLAAMGLLATGQ